MKKSLIVIALFFSVMLFAQKSHSNINWETNFEVAQKKAKKQNKPILMLFTGSDWCPPCKALKRDFFNSAEFKTYSKKFVFLYVDFPRNKELVTAAEQVQNKKLNSQYGVRSLPTVVVVKASGKEIDKIKGYNSTGETKYHYDFIKNIL